MTVVGGGYKSSNPPRSLSILFQRMFQATWLTCHVPAGSRDWDCEFWAQTPALLLTSSVTLGMSFNTFLYPPPQFPLYKTDLMLSTTKGWEKVLESSFHIGVVQKTKMLTLTS